MAGDETVTREILGNVPSWLAVVFYAAALAACAAAAIGFIMRFRRHRRGRRPQRETVPTRSKSSALAGVVTYLSFHRQLLRDRWAGLAHLLMFYGFFVLFIGTCLVALEHHTPLHFFYGRFYIIASLIIDLGGIVFIAGLVIFMIRRFVTRSPRLLPSGSVAGLSILLLAIAVTGFALEGARIAVDMPRHERWSVAGYAVALVLSGVGVNGENAQQLHRAMWIGHAVLCIAFFGLLPWGFFGHMVFGALSWATRTTRPRSQLRPAATADGAPGAVTWTDFTWRDLLQADACTTCGRCNDVCPAAAAGKPLRPREVVLELRRAMNNGTQHAASEKTDLLSAVTDDVLWSCTTCAACNDACPVGIEVYDKIVELRRGRVETGDIPDAAERVFESSAANFNPYDKPNADRMLWSGGLDLPIADAGEPIDLLYWIGCAGSFDTDGQAVARAMVRILDHLGVSYRVLANRERCTGDPARRMGEEGLFEQLARHNIATLDEHRVRRILTHCPHCFNTFANEYPTFGASFEVEHHSQFLSRMIRDGKLSIPAEPMRRITFHDPCYLGRGQGETAAPRDVLMSLPMAQLVEMPRHGQNSFCCGAGGGSMWLDVRGDQRVENIRAAEAAQTGADTIATACPFCKSMLDTGRESLEAGDQPRQVKDIAELVAEALGLPP